MLTKMRIALLVSGSGTTMRAILEATKCGALPRVEPALIIVSRQDSGAIQKAIAEDMMPHDICIIEPKQPAFGEAILDQCYLRGVDFVGQYGWMVKTPAEVIDRFKGMMVNQHPGPLDPGRPDFGGQGMYGLRVHSARLGYVRGTDPLRLSPFSAEYHDHFYTEVTAQEVAKEYDQGRLLGTRRLPILPNDTPETLQKRALREEHKLQIDILRLFSEGRMKPMSRRIRPLVAPEYYGILNAVKQVAIRHYP